MSHEEQEIRQLITTWMEATKRGDLETVLGSMAEDVVFLTPGNPPLIGRAAFEAASKAQTGPGGARPEIEGTALRESPPLPPEGVGELHEEQPGASPGAHRGAR